MSTKNIEMHPIARPLGQDFDVFCEFKVYKKISLSFVLCSTDIVCSLSLAPGHQYEQPYDRPRDIQVTLWDISANIRRYNHNFKIEPAGITRNIQWYFVISQEYFW